MDLYLVCGGPKPLLIDKMATLMRYFVEIKDCIKEKLLTITHLRNKI